MQNITSRSIRRFQNKSLLKVYGAAIISFYLGVKVCDYFFYDHDYFEEIREQTEDEYWEKFGEPVFLKPHLVNSIIPGKEHEIRKSWIYIKYESDKVVKKKDDWQI